MTEEHERSDRRLTEYERIISKILDINDVPEEIRDAYWAITSIHTQLTFYRPNELQDLRIKVRDLVRLRKWETRQGLRSYFQEAQVLFFFTDVLARKSINRGERELLATEIKRVENAEMQPPSKGIKATFSKVFGGGI